MEARKEGPAFATLLERPPRPPHDASTSRLRSTASARRLRPDAAGRTTARRGTRSAGVRPSPWPPGGREKEGAAPRGEGGGRRGLRAPPSPPWAWARVPPPLALRASRRRWPCARAAAAGSVHARRHPTPLPPEGTGRLAAGAGREGWGGSPLGREETKGGRAGPLLAGEGGGAERARGAAG
ncbi:hypothetical protein PVAP13_5NG561524 [Panicum virgatum]|uniref:Uncharacterized protein n=1 Tax=Panicum virgatum TaxID=38727 RepID=A0A8T0RW11_PANVG|nr:hypothetical protein PVAP13_5NG561524 [Panicum virgatum]